MQYYSDNKIILKIYRTLFVLTTFISFHLFIIPTITLSKSGEFDVTNLKEISNEGLNPFNQWWVDMYNDDRFLFAVCVTLIMMGIGMTIGFSTDFILRLFGIKTSKIVHHE
jgi:hypothetical protein